MKIAVIHSQIESLRPLIFAMQAISQVEKVFTGTDQVALEEILLEEQVELLITEFSEPYLVLIESLVKAGDLTVVFYTSLEEIRQIHYVNWRKEGVRCEFLFQEMNQFWRHLWMNKLITNIVSSQKEKRVPKVIVSDQANLRFLDIDEIYYLEKGAGQVILHTKNQHYFLNYTLEELQLRLSQVFFRSHRSYLVNVEKIESIQTTRRRGYQIRFLGTEKKAVLSYQRKAQLIKLWA